MATETGANMLADHKGETVNVICEDCEIFKRLDRDVLLGEHGNVTMPSLLPLVATSFGCQRVTNGFYNRCKLHFHHSPAEWAKLMGYIDPKAKKDDFESFADLSEWHRLYVHCQSCGRKNEIDRWRLERTMGKETTFSSIAKRLKCKKCSTRGMAKIVIVSSSRG